MNTGGRNLLEKGYDRCGQRTNTMNKSVLHRSSESPALPRGRLIFGVDATASRKHAWNIARDLQAKMFIEAGSVGVLSLQLVFYGDVICRASKWALSGEQLARWMGTIQCEAGHTQIEKVLRHALREHEKAPVQGITFIGDAMEENLDVLSGLADELGMAGVPLHMYQEGNDATVRNAFRLLALKTGGTYSAFNPAVPQTIERLAAQLNEVARVTVGSVAAIGTNRSRK
jgi:hypothetical protein